VDDFIDLRRLFLIVMRRWWLLVLVTALAAAAGYLFSQRQRPVYEATTTVLVGQIFQTANLDRQDLLTSELVAQTYSDLARRQPVLQSVVDNLDLTQTWQQLRSQISVELVEGTQLIQIMVDANSPLQAQLIADEVAQQMNEFSPTEASTPENAEVRLFVQQQLENLQARIEDGQNKMAGLQNEMLAAETAEQLSKIQGEASSLESLITNWENTYVQLLSFMQTGQSPNSLTIIEPAQANFNPVSPQVELFVLLGGVMGAFLALGLIFLLEYLNDAYKTPDEITQDFGLPVLGSIRNMGRAKGNSLGVYVSNQPRSPIAESFRMLRANLELISTDQPLKTILVTSCDKGVGKSTLSTNLAIIMAHSDRETILLDADLRNSSVHTLMGLPNELGLSDILRHEMDIVEALQWSEGVKGSVITGGAPPFNPSELLGSAKMDRILGRLKGISDVVIIDAPPLFVSDALVLSAKVDGVLLVVRLGHTRRKHVRSTLQQLERAGARVLGVVLNGVADRGDEYYGTYLYKNGHEANGRLPSTRNYWTGMLKKIGFAGSAASNGNSHPGQVGEPKVSRVSTNGKKPKSLAKDEVFCPNEDCPDYCRPHSKIQKNIIKAGKSKKGLQRYQCKTCGRSFSETAGTIFFRKRTPEREILETLALVAQGASLGDLSREMGFAADTVAQWLQEAAQHPEQVNDRLIKDFNVKPQQLDALWASVRQGEGLSADR